MHELEVLFELREVQVERFRRHVHPQLLGAAHRLVLRQHPVIHQDDWDPGLRQRQARGAARAVTRTKACFAIAFSALKSIALP